MKIPHRIFRVGYFCCYYFYLAYGKILSMNEEDGNSSMPQRPNFSSSDTNASTNGYPEMGNANAPAFFNQAMGDVVIYGDGNERRSKKNGVVKFVLAAAALVIIAVVVVVLFIRDTRISDPKEVGRAFSAFKSDYYSLISNYDWIDSTPVEFLDRRIKGKSFFLVEQEKIERDRANAAKARASFDALEKYNMGSIFDKELLGKYEKAKKQADDVMATIVSNADLLDEFYSAYAEPTYSIINGETVAASKCPQKSSEMQALEGKSETKAAAEKYYSAYCKINSLIYSGYDLDSFDEISELTRAKRELAMIIKDVSAPGSESKIVFRELASRANDEE